MTWQPPPDELGPRCPDPECRGPIVTVAASSRRRARFNRFRDRYTHICEFCGRAWIYDRDGLVTDPGGVRHA